MTARLTFSEAINKYYDLKNQYDTNKKEDIHDLIKDNEDKSWREKRILFKSMNHKCVNCKRYVNTDFNIIIKSEVDRHLTAKCGDKIEPCPLKIDINLGYIVTYEEGIISNQEQTSHLKQQIIIEKNNLMFGYISQANAIKQFDVLKDDLTSSINIYEDTNKILSTIVNNLEKKEQIITIDYNTYIDINSIKMLLKQYTFSKNTQFIDDAVKLYINDLLPKLNEYSHLTYAYKAVEYNANTYTLIKKKVGISDIEYNLGDIIPKDINDNVISFVTGLAPSKFPTKPAKDNTVVDVEMPDKYGPNVPPPKTKKARTLKASDSIKIAKPVKTKTKTVKAKKVDIILEDSDEEPEQKQEDIQEENQGNKEEGKGFDLKIIKQLNEDENNNKDENAPLEEVSLENMEMNIDLDNMKADNEKENINTNEDLSIIPNFYSDDFTSEFSEEPIDIGVIEFDSDPSI
jgi:hypothetical protein